MKHKKNFMPIKAEKEKINAKSFKSFFHEDLEQTSNLHYY